MVFICAYARLSSLEQSRGQTLESQIDLLQDWGYDQLYYDLESGRKTDRTQFTKMILEARGRAAQGEKVVIRVARHDRWARNAIYSLQLIGELEALGVIVESRDRGQLSLATATDWLITANEAIAAELESRRISERVRGGIEHKRKHGKPICTRPPWAYQHNQERSALEPDMREWGESGIKVWDLARLTIQKILNGESVRGASFWLYDAYGKRFSNIGIKRWIHNPVLRGHLQYRSVPGDIKSKSVLLYNKHLPLISEMEYQELCYQMRLSSSLRGANRGRRIYPVSGIVSCGYCDRKMLPQSIKQTGGTGYRRYFECPRPSCEGRKLGQNRIREEAIEAAIQEQLMDRAEEIIQGLTIPDEKPEDPAILSKRDELKDLKELLRRTGRETYRLAIEEIETEISLLLAQKKSPQVDQSLIEELRDPEFWNDFDATERRKLYEAMVRRVVVRAKQVHSVELVF